MNIVTGIVVKKFSWNLWVIKNNIIHIIHQDDFDHQTWKKIKIGDKVRGYEWHRININDIDKCKKKVINKKSNYYISTEVLQKQDLSVRELKKHDNELCH